MIETMADSTLDKNINPAARKPLYVCPSVGSKTRE
jgi:hypothetical protein